MPSARKIPLLAFYVALVAVSTVLLPLYVPATRGYYNIGEAAIFTVALLSGPYFGAVAGGMGSALADLILGYPIYAPATLLIKGLEGGVLGYLADKRPQFSRRRWVIFSFLIGIVLFLAVYLIGSTYYTSVDPLLLGVIATASAGLIILAGLFSSSEAGWQVLSCLIAGIMMVTGYFLYEQLLFGLGAAMVEIPVNLGQMVVGVLVAVPAYKSLRALSRKTK